MDNNVYVDIIEASQLFRNVFCPESIKEIWKTNIGPIKIKLQLDGIQYDINPKIKGNLIDMGIIFEINKIICHSGFSFEIFKVFDSTSFVLVLSPEEKHVLQDYRGWEFEF